MMTTRSKNILLVVGALLGGLLLGWMLFSGGGGSHQGHSHTQEAGNEVWTCSMHPSIRQSEPGACPICGMDLTLLQAESDMKDPHLFEMSSNALRLANVQTLKLGTANPGRQIRLNGRVEIDERRLAVQTADVPGRIEQLMVSFTGEAVNRGQALARIYSPELVTAQEELLQAYQMREMRPELLEAAKAKLQHWRISDGQIDRILEEQQPSETFMLRSSEAGVVTEKMVDLGDYVERGQPLYEIADLSSVWVLLDIYENMAWIAVGDKVEFSVASYPGEIFEGTVNFVDPVLNDLTRVSTARIEVENPRGRLKPQMLVSAEVQGGKSAEAEMLTVPKSAVLWTGERSVVYVKEPTKGAAVFGLREVVLGPMHGDEYVIRKGLTPGEEVVVNGAFTIDAAAQLAGKPSMMSRSEAPEVSVGGQAELDLLDYLESRPHHFENVASSNFGKGLQDLTEKYLHLKNTLVESHEEASRLASEEFQLVLQEVQPTGLEIEAEVFWKERRQSLEAAIERMVADDGLASRRNAFTELSMEMAKLLSAFGTGGERLYVDHCPMANSDLGAYWLSADPQVRNPYYGDAMLVCGEVVKEL